MKTKPVKCSNCGAVLMEEESVCVFCRNPFITEDFEQDPQKELELDLEDFEQDPQKELELDLEDSKQDPQKELELDLEDSEQDPQKELELNFGNVALGFENDTQVDLWNAEQDTQKELELDLEDSKQDPQKELKSNSIVLPSQYQRKQRRTREVRQKADTSENKLIKNVQINKQKTKSLNQILSNFRRFIREFYLENRLELQKPSARIGIFVSLLTTGLLVQTLLAPNWWNAIFPQDTSSEDVSLSTNNVEPGIYQYGGVEYFKALKANNLNKLVEERIPGIGLRYYSLPKKSGIDMVLDEQLTLAYSGRPLSDSEYERAKVRGYEIRQVPIAIDTIVIVGPREMPISAMNLEQLKKVLEGEIVSWNQLNPKAQNIPIKPYIHDQYELFLVGADTKASTLLEFSDPDSLVTKIISTKGSIGLLSASFVEGQQLIKIADLAAADQLEYASPFINGSLNSEAILEEKYPLTKNIYIVYREDGTRHQKAAEEYIKILTSPDGQSIIRKSGLVPMGSI